ncbi:hypothetical protein DRN69_04490 [Candidatus Pacearchaeota archaeon]|nr:MAG: hypothetical protein DRN69_04490 [Candidatus Pacearchaeota archaeon]
MAITNMIRRKYTFSFGATDTSKNTSIDFTGKLAQIHVRVPNWTNDVTCTVKIKDVDDYVIYDSGAKSRNANYNLAVDQIVDDECKIELTLSGAPGGSGGSVVVVFWSHGE